MSITGILLQSGVLVFTGFTVYHPTWRENFLKNDAAIMGYAYPLLVVGTVLLVIGMLICSAVIERSTHETVWTTRKPLGLANTAPPVLARPPSVTDDLKKTPVVTSKTVVRGGCYLPLSFTYCSQRR